MFICNLCIYPLTICDLAQSNGPLVTSSFSCLHSLIVRFHPAPGNHSGTYFSHGIKLTRKSAYHMHRLLCELNVRQVSNLLPGSAARLKFAIPASIPRTSGSFEPVTGYPYTVDKISVATVLFQRKEPPSVFLLRLISQSGATNLRNSFSKFSGVSRRRFIMAWVSFSINAK